ncbi:MAG: ABC transporter ATP-binding protein [Lentisphaerae bacterium]|nr:ABC transporter ATP-binding protein [Lentisphaerota bacterium]
MGTVANRNHRGESGRLATQRSTDRANWFWALQDVSFSVQPGEVVGVIGSNGAGKSTLLKILARITEPTCGRARLVGRVSALLEVGTGFHPELTGRENVSINGAILGMSEQEIKRNFDGIVDFADMEDFIDTPVKRYSSGMRTRLAFAVAIHLDPDVLLVDEVLAVGDAEFQRKCLGKMEELAGNGRSVVFVSHRLSSVAQMCSRALWIDHGRIRQEGPSSDVIEAYLSTVTSSNGEVRWEEGVTSPHLKGLSLRAVRLINHCGQVAAAWLDSAPFDLEIEYELAHELAGLRWGFEIALQKGPAGCASLQPDADPSLGRAGIHRVRARIPGGLITPGQRRITVLADLPARNRSIPIGLPLAFDVEASAGDSRHRGLASMAADWTTLAPSSGPIGQEGA